MSENIATDVVEKSDQKKRKLSPEMFVAVLAVIISLSTLFVYIYQSNLMKQKQKMSVWPHLTIGPSVGDDYFIIRMLNQVIGPAIIKHVSIEYDGNLLEDIQQIMEIVRIPYSHHSVIPTSGKGRWLWPVNPWMCCV